MTHAEKTGRSILRRPVIGTLALILLLPHTAGSDSSQTNSDAAEHELRDVEARLSAALSGPSVDLLSHIWADDFVSTMADGHIVSREERLASLRAKVPEGSGKVSSSNDRIDTRVYGGWAVVLVTSTWHVDGIRVGVPYQATHVWAKKEHEWRLVAAHISEVKP